MLLPYDPDDGAALLASPKAAPPARFALRREANSLAFIAITPHRYRAAGRNTAPERAKAREPPIRFPGQVTARYQYKMKLSIPPMPMPHARDDEYAPQR